MRSTLRTRAVGAPLAARCSALLAWPVAPRTALLLAALLALNACALEPVQPWQKRALAQRSMRLEPNRLEADFETQIYASKEAATGAQGVGAGGCGCN
jgi:hypothetical protein